MHIRQGVYNTTSSPISKLLSEAFDTFQYPFGSVPPTKSSEWSRMFRQVSRERDLVPSNALKYQSRDVDDEVDAEV